MSEKPATRSGRVRRAKPISAIATKTSPAWHDPTRAVGQAANLSLPGVPTMPAVPQADALVLIVSVTAAAAETAALGIEKHKLGDDGLLEIAQETVPV